MTIPNAKSITDTLRKNKILTATIIFIILYTSAAIIVSVLRFRQFEFGYFDFGIFDQIIWSASRFNIPITYHPNFIAVGGFNIHLADHFNPSIYLLSPLYWLTSRQEVILIAQSVTVGLSALVGVILARKFIKNDFIIFALIFSYLGFVGLQNALITEFHEATISPLFILISFWAIVTKKWKIYYLSLIMILGLKETFAGLGVGLGLFILLYDRKNWKHGVATFIICISWALITTKLIIPTFSGHPYFYTPGNTLESFTAMIQSFFHFDIRLKTLFYSFLSFGFLPLFNLPLLPAILENFLTRFLSDGTTRFTLALHYSAPLAALMFSSSVLVFSKMEKSKRLKKIIIPYAAFLIVNTFILHQFILHGPLALSYNKTFYLQTKNNQYVEDFIKKIPKDHGLIMTQNNIALRFAHQKVMLLDQAPEHFNPSVIAINLTPGQNPNNFFPLNYETATSLKDRLLIDPLYKVTKHGDELYIFKKNK